MSRVVKSLPLSIVFKEVVERLGIGQVQNQRIALIALVFFSFIGVSAQAAPLNHLEVQNDLVIFSTGEVKSHIIPACVTAENNQLWAVSLNTQKGVFTHAMLLTAISSNKPIEVITANRCEDNTTFEAVLQVRLLDQ